ncbi:hypothetical protein D3C80_1084060 [compost metagenome]
MLNHGATDVEQVVVLHSGRTGGFTVAAGQAAVQVSLGLGRDRLAFEHLLDQVNASARTIQLIAQQLVGGAGGRAEPAMHAGAQNTFGFLGTGKTFGLFAQISLHGALSDFGVQAARVEDALGIELQLEIAVVAQQRSVQWMERRRI